MENEEGKEEDKPETESGFGEEESRQLKRVLVVMGVLAFVFLGVFLFINSVRQFTYEGADFEVVKEGELILYKTSLPINSKKVFATNAIVGNYNFYFRNDPRRIKNIPVEGELSLMKNVVMNFTGDFKCDGDGIIAVANMVNVFNVLGVNSLKNESLGCDSEGKYTFLNLQVANESSIEQVGPSCYNLNINNCEVLEVTERYLVAILSEVNKKL